MRLFMVLVVVLALSGCATSPSGKVVGSRSTNTWRGAAYYLMVEDRGAMTEIEVTKDRYHEASIGDHVDY